VSPVRYELGFYIPEDGIIHSHCRENRKSYIALTGGALLRGRNVCRSIQSILKAVHNIRHHWVMGLNRGHNVSGTG
jgi:hypothetical protein